MPNRAVQKIIGNRFFLTVEPDLPVMQAAALMRTHEQGAVLVLEHDELLGICTERDIVSRVVADGHDPLSVRVGEIMTRDPVVIPPAMPFGNALHVMFECGFRHLPVLDLSGRALGIISAQDALALDIIQFSSELKRREELAEAL